MILSLEQKAILDVAKILVDSCLKKKEVNLRDIDFDSLNWELFEKYLWKHSVFLIAYNYIKPFIPVNYLSIFTEKYEYQIHKIDAYVKELSYINFIAEQNNIEIVFVKGLALSMQIYNSVYTRGFGDLDIVVRGKIEDTVRFKNLLIDELGYKQRIGVHEIPFPIDEIGVFHEFWLYRYTEDGIKLKVEIKQATSAICVKMISDFIDPKNTQDLTIGNAVVRTNNTEYALLHLFANVYGNTEKRIGVERKNILRDYIDVSLYIAKYNKEIVWRRIKELADKYDVTHKVYNVLLKLRYIGFINNLIEDHILDMFKPANLELNYINSVGGKVTWSENNPVDRLFDVRGRLAEYIKLQYFKNLSERNHNLSSKLFLNTESYVFWNPVSQKLFGNSDVLYSFFFDSRSKSITARIKISNKQYDCFPYVIAFMFYNGGRPYFMYVETKDSKCIYSISSPEDRKSGKTKEDLEKKECTISKFDNSIIIESSISLNDLGQSLKPGLICYNVVIHKYVYEDISIIVDVKFCEENDPEEWYDHMGVIQYE